MLKTITYKQTLYVSVDDLEKELELARKQVDGRSTGNKKVPYHPNHGFYNQGLKESYERIRGILNGLKERSTS